MPAGSTVTERRGVLPHIFGEEDPFKLISEGREGNVDLEEFGGVAHIEK